jgi:cytochrome c biogenesis protein CcdA
MERMKAHFGLNAASLASFTSIGPARDAGSEPAFLEPAKEPAPAHHPVTLVYFFSPGCAECDKVSRLLENLQNGPVSVQIQKHNIKTSEGGLLNQALCLRLGVPSAQQGVSPSIFTPAGALVTTAITPQALDELLARASATPTPPEWAAISAEERGQAGAALGEKFQQLTLLVVLGGGLLDGINPCAFATLIFFLSYLHVAKRTPRQILGVGIAFISAIFITYFLAGLVLFQFLSWLDQLAWARKALNGFFALFALGVGLFSLRDAWLARQGRLQDMTLQLPGFLKDRIRSTIRGGARQSRYVLAAFTTGIVISLLELACTGQVYAPIIHAVQQGADNAITWLLIYNLAFISPLVIIFLLAFAGMKTNALIQFQQKHTALVKLLLGLLFIGLFLLLAFGSHLLPGAKP